MLQCLLGNFRSSWCTTRPTIVNRLVFYWRSMNLRSGNTVLDMYASSLPLESRVNITQFIIYFDTFWSVLNCFHCFFIKLLSEIFRIFYRNSCPKFWEPILLLMNVYLSTVVQFFLLFGIYRELLYDFPNFTELTSLVSFIRAFDENAQTHCAHVVASPSMFTDVQIKTFRKRLSTNQHDQGLSKFISRFELIRKLFYVCFTWISLFLYWVVCTGTSVLIFNGQGFV